MTRARGLFVTGTDTGGGKTVVACALIRGLRELGLDACGMKPIETGVGPEGPLDALALRAAAGGADPLDDVCPQRFALPAAPTVAAEAEARKVDVDAIHGAFARLASRHAWVIVEGAGGLLVPAGPGGLTMGDVALALELPLVIVARAALGTINHTRLTLGAAAALSLEVVGLVISHANGPLSAADAANLDALRRAPGAPLLGEIPPLAAGARPQPGALDVASLVRG